jgi:FAD/FMN-containing dehydrogenase
MTLTTGQDTRLVELIDAVEGPVLVPGDAGYPAEVAMWNLALVHTPAVVVGATSARDVELAVRFAADHGLAVGVAATGHGAYASMDDAVLVSTRRMTGVVVDAARRTVRIEAGALWQDVVDAAAPHGLAPLAGSSPNVGAVGYTVGGGLSPTLGRRFGWAADHVRALDVVTAQGRLVRVDARSDPDLFWALRGGRGSFGIVTALEAALFPVSELYGGGLFVDGEHARDTLAAWHELARTAPDELSTSFAFLRLPAAPFVPEILQDRVVLHVRIAWTGDPAQGARLIAPLRAVGGLLIDTVAVIPFTAMAAVHQDPVDPVPALERAATLTGLPWDAVERLIEVAGPDAVTPAALVEVRLLGGALARPSAVPSAVGRRDAAYTILAIAMAPVESAPVIGPALDAVVAALRPWHQGILANFTTSDTSDAASFRDAYDPQTYRRLATIKRRVDPSNLFRANTNIPPAPIGAGDDDH